MKKFTLTVLFALIPMTASAVPNVWEGGEMTQGWIEYGISNEKNQVIQIACNAGFDEDTDHSVRFNGKDVNGHEFLIDGESHHPLNMYTKTTYGALAWDMFATAISKGKKIEIYKNNKKLATFKPTAKSIKNIASGIANCSALGS